MKRICFFCGDITRGGGTEKVTQILANALALQNKYEIIILSLSDSNKPPFFNLNSQVKTFVLKHKWSRFLIIDSIIQLNSFVLKHQIDILINVDVMLGLYSLPVKLLHNRLNLISWEQFSIKNNLGVSWLTKIRQIALLFSNYYVCLTHGDLNDFKRNFVVRTKLRCIYNPLEKQSQISSRDVEQRKLIVTAGNFYHAKGFDLAIDVAEIVLLKNPDWKWVFYGDGVEEVNLKKKVENKHLENKIIFAGRIKDITKKFAEASLYVMTSRTEGFGLVLLEAKLCSLPIVVFDVPYGPREIVENNINGFLIKPFDIEEMALTINRIINDNDLRVKLSKNACSNIDKFLLDNIVDEWVRMFDD